MARPLGAVRIDEERENPDCAQKEKLNPAPGMTEGSRFTAMLAVCRQVGS
jgi:hypothetical protein